MKKGNSLQLNEAAKVPFDIRQILIYAMAWCRAGNQKSLPEQIISQIYETIYH